MKKLYIILLFSLSALSAKAQIEMFDESVQKKETPQYINVCPIK